MPSPKTDCHTIKTNDTRLPVETKIITEPPLLMTTSFTVLSAHNVDIQQAYKTIAQLNSNVTGGYYAISQNGEQILVKFTQRFVICGTTNVPAVAKRAASDGVIHVRGAVYSLMSEEEKHHA